MPQDSDDALSRRDMGLEFLNVTSQVLASRIASNRHGNTQQDTYRLTNNSTSIVDTHLLLVARGLPSAVALDNGSGVMSTGDPYQRVFLSQGVLMPGQSIVQTLVFRIGHGHGYGQGHGHGHGHGQGHGHGHRHGSSAAVNYGLDLLSGQGKP